MKFTVDSACSIGAFRDNNEDILVWGEDRKQDFFWLLIGDGMGGHKAGDVASRMLADAFEAAVKALDGYYELHWPNWIERTFKSANLTIWEKSQSSSDFEGMGTTGVFVVYRAGQYHVGWVGDSRAYRYSQDELTLLTRDHSAIHYLLDKGSITQAEADDADDKHLLARALGTSKNVVVDTVSGPWSAEDMLLLSSDGLHDYVSEAEMIKHLQAFAKNNKVCDELVEQAIRAGSQDNISVGLARFETN